MEVRVRYAPSPTGLQHKHFTIIFLQRVREENSSSASRIPTGSVTVMNLFRIFMTLSTGSVSDGTKVLS